MRTSPSLVIGIDDTMEHTDLLGWGPKERRNYLRDILQTACNNFTGLATPNGKPVSLKLNTLLRALGHECIEMVELAGLGLFADYKFGQEVLDTMWADCRALQGYNCLQRITFRYDCQVEFLAGLGEKKGACSILPNVSFLPVGPVTDLQERFYLERLHLSGRPQAMREFGTQVAKFGTHVNELICAPSDIQHFDPEIWEGRNAVTPAVRPKGLSGNAGNDINAFDVEKAVEAGSSALVIASPIMRAEHPRQAAELVISQIQAAA